MTGQQLLDIARKACEAGKAAGADFVEVRVSTGKGVSVRLERSAIDTAEVKQGSGASIRAFRNGGLGSVSLDGLDLDRVVQGAREAAEMASFAVADRDFVTLPEPESAPEVSGLYDAEVERLGVPELAQIAMECVEAAKAEAPDAVCTGAASAGSGHSAMANSLGIAHTSESSSVSAWIEPIIRRGDDVGAYYDFDAGRRLADFDHRQIGASAARTARQLLGAVKVESGEMPVVLGPLCASSLFESLAASAGAESHQRGRSWLCGKLGQQIASTLVTVRDDATIAAGLGSRAYDSEGVPSRPITIIENGVLINLLHNSYTANKAKAQYTGHAQGGGIGPTNANPDLGSLTSDEIIRGVKRGLYINM